MLLPAHIQDMGVLVFSNQHIMELHRVTVYIVQLMEMDCLNKINLWMMENLHHEQALHYQPPFEK